MIDVVLTSVKENWKIIGIVCSKIDGSLGDSRLAYIKNFNLFSKLTTSWEGKKRNIVSRWLQQEPSVYANG